MLHGLGKVIVSLLTVTLFAWAGTMPGTRFEYGSNQVFSNADTSASQTNQPQQQPQLGLDTNTQKSSVSLSDQPSEARHNTIPENPTEQLPDKVDTSIPDSATLVSPDYAVTQQGELKNVETGTTVTDTKLVGTVSKPADPLAKTEGKSFIPVPLSTLKDAVENKDSKNSTAQSSYKNQSDILAYPAHNGTETSEASVLSARAESGLSPSDTKQNKTEQIALGNNEYGAYWGTYGGTPAFFESNGTLFAQQAKGVVDVSQWQGTIDWAKAKAAGVEGAIIRISFGWGNGFDLSALRNISECKRLGIPFGIYSYSYAYDSSTGAAEGADMVSLLKQAGVSPNDLSYPVFYDLENWTWAGHAPPTIPSVYEGIVNAWYAKLQDGGYNNLSVYSYTSYLNTSLNAPSIRAKTRWVASYGARTGFPYSTNDRGWQYTSSGTVAGINGSVDLNAFGNLNPNTHILWQVRDEDIAVGAAVDGGNQNFEYRWQSYDLASNTWAMISDWSLPNWSSWKSTPGDYWLHLEVRDSTTKSTIGSQTISFRYSAGTTAITGTYSGYSNNQVLLGMSSNNPKAQYVIKIYDYQAKQWVSQFSGQWALWNPKPGIYWTHYEVYTSDGRLADTRTYAFGV